MTPAKLWELSRVRFEELELKSLPIDKLAWIYSNKNRDPGNDNSEYGPVRDPAPFMDLDLFRTYYVHRKETLAAKDDGIDHALLGASANMDAWMSWAESKKEQ